ncbi:uncharacterized protein LOC131229790 [Magnolia sinica]|uniref:uncharacterized protein LOC131229790 n=1 Tax=Magnolia sinica TaxID=86752 RepID=UPI002657D7F0|nr:uncharacterized protein LOC131229790 [Magnolia sinica]
MSRKTDFTQKLLDDLRLRKQRLAAAQTPSDARGNLRRPHQGTGDANIPKTNGYRPNHGRHRSLAIEDASKEIVPIQTTRSSEYISDLSMALAYALENGGRLGNIEFLGNAMVRKKASLHHAQRRSLDLGEMSGRYTSESHQLVTGRSTTSHLHIREISKGAQKLNQILKACAHGLNFDRYSIEIGKELLKGAVDLEESLRMLVNLQEASQYMVSPKGKQRIRLLEGEEDDEAIVEVKGQRFPEKPRFSFDGSSRNSIEDARDVTKTSLKQKLLTLPYHSSSTTHQPDTDKQALIIPNSVYHRRSMSFNPDSEVISTFSGATKNFRSNKPSNPKAPENSSMPSNSKNGNKIKQSNSHSPEQEKGRIPNVIAKLMGLEEIPLKADLKNKGVEKVSDSRQGTKRDENLKQKAQRSLKDDSVVTTSEKPVSQITRQVKELQANKIATTRNTTIMTAVNDGKQNLKEVKNMENTNPLPLNSERPTLEINLQINATCMDRIKETQKAKQDAKGRGDNTKPKDQKSDGLGNLTQPVFTFALQEKRLEYREAADSETAGTNKRLQKEHKGPMDGISMLGYRQETVYDSEPRQTSGNQKSESDKAKQDGAGEKSAKIKPQVKDARKTDMMLKNPLKPIPRVNPQKKMLQRNQNLVAGKKSSTETPNAMQPKENGSSTYFESNMKKSANGSLEEQRLLAQKTNAERIAALILPVGTNKAVHPPSVHKVDTEHVEAQESKKHVKTKDTRNRMAGSPQATAQQIKQKPSVLQELKHRRHEGITKVKEAIISIHQPTKLEKHLQRKDAPASTPCDHVGDDCRTPKETEKNIAANSNRHYINSKGPAVLPLPEISLGGYQALKSDFQAIQSRVTGTDNGNIIGNNSLREQLQPNTKPEIQGGSLTKHENHLKQILVKSQHFLNTAEALFRLQIPFDIFHASRNKREDKENKLLLDCAYEIMKRKGDIEELGFHSSVGMPIVSMKLKCLDDLVKQLHEDLEHLEFRGETGGDNYDAAATFLHETLKGDIENRKPDVNCMWDFGWNEMMFVYLEKDEVVKDVEKHVLNRLIDEITGDLLHASIEKSYYKAAS